MVCEFATFSSELLSENDAALITEFFESKEGKLWADVTKNELNIDHISAKDWNTINTFLDSNIGEVYWHVASAISNEFSCILLRELDELGYDTQKERSNLIEKGIFLEEMHKECNQ